MTTRRREINPVNEKDTFILNDIIKFSSEFRVKSINNDNEEEFVLNNPSIVEFKIKKPNGVVEAFTYNTIDGATTNNNVSSPNNLYNIFDNGTGIFCIEYQLNYPGTWNIRWEGKREPATSLDDINSFGISVTSNRIYIVDNSAEKKIFVYDHSGNRHISEEFDLVSVNINFTGVAVTSNRIYVVNSFVNNKIYVYDHNGNNIEYEEFDLHDDNNSPSGISVTSNRIYVVDSNSNKAFVYDYGGHRQIDDEFDLVNIDNDTPSGIFVTSNRAYVTDANEYRVYVYDHSENLLDPSEDFDLIRTDLTPKGVSVYDDKIYVVVLNSEETPTRAYVHVYDLNGDYQPDRSFSLLGSVPHNAVGAAESSLKVISSGVLG